MSWGQTSHPLIIIHLETPKAHPIYNGMKSEKFSKDVFVIGFREGGEMVGGGGKSMKRR